MVANRQNNDTVPGCVAACVEFLINLRNHGVLLLDTEDRIRLEYASALNQGRPYQLGAQFLLHIYQNQFNEKYVRRVPLEQNEYGDYAAFPDAEELDGFDPSDRKFAALSRVTNVPVTNAVDSDWADSCEALNKHGIHVNFLCGGNKTEWFN